MKWRALFPFQTSVHGAATVFPFFSSSCRVRLHLALVTSVHHHLLHPQCAVVHQSRRGNATSEVLRTQHRSSNGGAPPASTSAALVSSSPPQRSLLTNDGRRRTGKSLSSTSTTRPPPGGRSTAGPSPHTFQGTPGKHHRRGGGDGKEIKVRQKAPWGLQQLRDSWSEDAMTSRETENMSERVHREYRYHPDEYRRHYVKYAAFLLLPGIIFGASASYFFHTGKMIWEGDPQEILNYIRLLDTSPRSKLYANKMHENMLRLPPHIQRYREEHAGEKERSEELFAVTHTAFRKPLEEELRMVELLRLQKKAAAIAPTSAEV